MTTTAPNLGKTFNGVARPATEEDIKILIPGDWIKRQEHPWCYQFKKWDGDKAICTWEGDEFFVPHHLLMVVEVLEGCHIKKFRKPDSKFKVGDRVITPALASPRELPSMVGTILEIPTSDDPDKLDYDYKVQLPDGSYEFFRPEWLKHFVLQVGDRVRITKTRTKNLSHWVGKIATITSINTNTINVEAGEAVVKKFLTLKHGWYEVISDQLPSVIKSESKFKVGRTDSIQKPWDSPQAWLSAGVQCRYENGLIFWGDLQFEVDPKIKAKYLNPRVVVDFLEDSWCDLKAFISYIAKLKSATEKEVIEHYGCEKSLVKNALKLGIGLGFLIEEKGQYKIVCGEPPDPIDFATPGEFSKAWNNWTPACKFSNDVNSSQEIGGFTSKAELSESEIKHISKPVLSSDVPIAVVLFAAGGGVEAGMIEAGIRPVVAVEFDPKKPKLSSAIADCHERNFSQYGCRIIRKSVQEVAASGFSSFPRNPFNLHSSQMCSNFSNAKAGDAIETDEDVEMASATATAIRELQPETFTLENVPRYRNSQSFKIIAQALEEEGYLWRGEVMRLLDCQTRDRFVVVASKDYFPPLPKLVQPRGWHEIVADLIPGMADSKLVSGQVKALEEFLSNNEPTPLLIERTGARGEYRVKPAHLPCNTLRSSVFTDGKGGNRNRFADIWLPDGVVKSVSIEAAARLQGFPDWYEFPSDTATAGSIIGYSVPPKFAAQLFKILQKPRKQPSEIQLCQELIKQYRWRLASCKDKQSKLRAREAIACQKQKIRELLVPKQYQFAYRQMRQKGITHTEALSVLSTS